MKRELICKATFVVLTCLLVSLCSFYIIHNAAWLLGDDCTTLVYTGWDKPIFGFFVSPTLGRFFPLDYTIYDVLLPFFDGQISPTAHYAVNVICFILFIVFFIWLSFFILKDQSVEYRYIITFFLIVLIIGRTFINFAQCWSGVWTIFTFLPLFVVCSLRFLEKHQWGYAIIALVAINYVLYYYEIMFVIPLTIGVCAFVFSVSHLSRQDKLYYALLVASGILFLLLYAILVLPKVDSFYSHHSGKSLFQNALRMFVAQKIMWLTIAFLFVRMYHLIKKDTSFCFYDCLLLSSCSYFCCAAVLGLDFTLYYTPGALIAIPAILAFSVQYLKIKWTVILFLVLTLFYGRKIPAHIKVAQTDRISTYANVQQFIDHLDGEKAFFYEPDDDSLERWQWEERHIQRFYLEKVAGWYMMDEGFSIDTRDRFTGERGLWQVPTENTTMFLQDCPEASFIVNLGMSSIYSIQ